MKKTSKQSKQRILNADLCIPTYLASRTATRRHKEVVEPTANVQRMIIGYWYDLIDILLPNDNSDVIYYNDSDSERLNESR